MGGGAAAGMGCGKGGRVGVGWGQGSGGAVGAVPRRRRWLCRFPVGPTHGPGLPCGARVAPTSAAPHICVLAAAKFAEQRLWRRSRSDRSPLAQVQQRVEGGSGHHPQQGQLQVRRRCYGGVTIAGHRAVAGRVAPVISVARSPRCAVARSTRRRVASAPQRDARIIQSHTINCVPLAGSGSDRSAAPRRGLRPARAAHHARNPERK